jgi:cytochrome c oxidase assembly protein subunit 15
MWIFSFFLLKDKKQLFFASLLTILGMGFEAWLGKTVVDSNLLPYKITIHMIGSFFILSCILFCIHRSRTTQKKIVVSKTINIALLIALVLTLVQVAIGTQVRQFVDEQVIQIGYDKSSWLNNPTLDFYIHRSFSLVVIGLNIWLFLQFRTLKLHTKLLNFVLLIISLEVLTGIAMSYFDFPFGSQPIHLVLASILFGLQFYLLLLVQNKHVI